MPSATKRGDPQLSHHDVCKCLTSFASIIYQYNNLGSGVITLMPLDSKAVVLFIMQKPKNESTSLLLFHSSQFHGQSLFNNLNTNCILVLSSIP